MKTKKEVSVAVAALTQVQQDLFVDNLSKLGTDASKAKLVQLVAAYNQAIDPTPAPATETAETAEDMIDEALASVKCAKATKEPCGKALALINAMDALAMTDSKAIEVKSFGTHGQSRVCRIDLTVECKHKGMWAALVSLEKCLKAMNGKAERGTFIIHSTGAFAAFGKL